MFDDIFIFVPQMAGLYVLFPCIDFPKFYVSHQCCFLLVLVSGNDHSLQFGWALASCHGSAGLHEATGGPMPGFLKISWGN